MRTGWWHDYWQKNWVGYWHDYREKWRFALDQPRDRGPWRYTTWMGAKWQRRFLIALSVLIAAVVAVGLIVFWAFILQSGPFGVLP